MASGSARQEKASDQQCENCGRWFDGRGIDAHVAHCDGPDEDDRPDRADASSSAATVWDPEPEPTEKQTETESATETMSETTCPDCSESDEVYQSGAVKVHLAAQNQLTPANLEKLEANSHFCNRCNRVFSDD